MNVPLRILHLEANASDAGITGQVLMQSSAVFERLVVADKDSYVKALNEYGPGIILSDHAVPSLDANRALAMAWESGLIVPFLVVTNPVSETFAVEILKSGACDYVLKENLHQLPAAIQQALQKYQRRPVRPDHITHMHRPESKLFSQQMRTQRLVAETSILAQEQEREEIGKELHDNINQVLTATKLYLEFAKVAEPGLIPDLLDKSYKNIVQAIEEIRHLSHRLVPPSLGNMGLEQAIRQLVSNIRIVSPLQLLVNAEEFDEAGIDPGIRLTFYRIVQEQINNILNHSQAGNAVIVLRSLPGFVTLTVHDDGKGFDTRHTPAGIGLRNITNRAAVYNGTAKIISAPGKGCTLEVIVPCEKLGNFGPDNYREGKLENRVKV